MKTGVNSTKRREITEREIKLQIMEAKTMLLMGEIIRILRWELSSAVGDRGIEVN